MMTEAERRLALVTGSCPECGHGILTHKKGTCLAIIRIGGTNREPIKGHCGCTHIQPLDAQQQRLAL